MATHFARSAFSANYTTTHRLPSNLITHASRFNLRHRQRFLTALALLAELMFNFYGYHTLPVLITSSSGRPCFADNHLPDFSLAYTGNIVGVMLAEKGCRAGLDIEMIRAHNRQKRKHLADKFSCGEQAWINSQQDPLEAATQIWVLRQSILKLTGEGDSGMTSLCLHPAYGRLRSFILPDVHAICDAEPALVWSCALSPACDQLKLWEWDYKGLKELHTIQVQKQNMGPHLLRLTSLPHEGSLML